MYFNKKELAFLEAGDILAHVCVKDQIFTSQKLTVDPQSDSQKHKRKCKSPHFYMSCLINRRGFKMNEPLWSLTISNYSYRHFFFVKVYSLSRNLPVEMFVCSIKKSNRIALSDTNSVTLTVDICSQKSQNESNMGLCEQSKPSGETTLNLETFQNGLRTTWEIHEGSIRPTFGPTSEVN